VVVGPSFFDQLDAQLPQERTSDGTPFATDLACAVPHSAQCSSTCSCSRWVDAKDVPAELLMSVAHVASGDDLVAIVHSP
jgi:hypothetical protein